MNPEFSPMRRRWPARCRLALGLLSSILAVASPAAPSTINAVHRFAHGANFGWIDWRGDGANGAVIGAFVCSGHIYAANVGWISLGQGAPAGGVRYANDTSTDFGVNHDGAGNLSGYAYGANIGWLVFTNQAANGVSYDGPKVSLLTGRLSGFVWSANCGWISLSNAHAYVQTDAMDLGPDRDGDGLPDAWELAFAPNLGVLTGDGDHDGDGVSDREEFAADTNPLDANSRLRITSAAKATPESPTTLTWSSSPKRLYRIHAAATLNLPVVWEDAGLGLVAPDTGPATTRDVAATGEPQRSFRVEAVQPLQP